MTDPVIEYKRLMGTAHTAAQAHAEHERRRALELGERLRELSKEVTEAGKREADVLAEVTGWWSQETRGLAGVDWLDLAPPSADLSADPRKLNSHLREITPATTAFRAALRRAIWPRKLP
ncbi:hypothetical protein ACFPM7_14080 [Actinokineospora guangxiensis]|uniref:Uncharacterized protein n=1 Tax=Actinokineospora guangxiensis TaxID=1490288 RepID=A0ABW0EQ33_9PSEU